jgi:hypothetical protein
VFIFVLNCSFIFQVLCYVSAGASLFCVCHGWSYVDSFFFCFAALGTIGIVENQATKDETMETGGALFVLVIKL